MVFFASDFHLGYPNIEQSRERERKIVRWLEQIAPEAEQLHLVGDIFDFWFEWKRVVPKYFVRFMGTVAKMVDSGIKVHFYVGNHDVWTFGYLEQELGMIVHRKPEVQTILSKRFFVEHGDQNPFESKTYRLVSKVFRNRFAQRLYANLLHPDWSAALAQSISMRKDKMHTVRFLGEEEPQIKYVHWLKRQGIDADFYVFGHRHLAIVQQLEQSTVVFLGQWINQFTFAVFDGNELMLKSFS